MIVSTPELTNLGNTSNEAPPAGPAGDVLLTGLSASGLGELEAGSSRTGFNTQQRKGYILVSGCERTCLEPVCLRSLLGSEVMNMIASLFPLSLVMGLRLPAQRLHDRDCTPGLLAFQSLTANSLVRT